MRKIIMKLSARNDVICFSADSSVLCNGFYNTAHSNFQNVLTMASNEVLILHVDASKKSDGECLCTGENRAATRLRKERKDRNSSPGPEVSIVSVKNTKPKRKKLNKSCPSDPKRCVPGTVTLLLSSGDEDEIEMMEVDSAKADKPTTSNASNSSSRTRNDSLTSPSTSSGSSSVGKDKEQGTGASKSTTDNSASTSSSSTSSKQQLESDYLAALRLSRALNSKPLSSSSSSGIDCDKNDVVLSDAVLAKTLQEKEYGVLNPKRDVAFVMESRVVIPGASPSSSSSSSSNTHHSSLDGVHHPNAVIPTPLKTTTDSQRNPNPLHRKHPTCWTECPSCPPDAIRKYHLIEVMSSSAEWDVIAKPVMEAGFTVTRMRRIQNDALWQRLCFEKQLMLRERPDVNEKFLYHTTRSQVSVICEEGLDQRLSRSVGNFGSGIYFRYYQYFTVLTYSILL